MHSKRKQWQRRQQQQGVVKLEECWIVGSGNTISTRLGHNQVHSERETNSKLKGRPKPDHKQNGLLESTFSPTTTCEQSCFYHKLCKSPAMRICLGLHKILFQRVVVAAAAALVRSLPVISSRRLKQDRERAARVRLKILLMGENYLSQ